MGVSNYLSYIIVDAGFDEADDRKISKQAYAIDHRGKQFSTRNIKHHLAMRNLMQEIRDCGEFTKGPPPFSKKDVYEFANQLNQILTKERSV